MMKSGQQNRRVLLTALLVLVIGAGGMMVSEVALSHAVVTESSLRSGSVNAGEATTVSLDFNSDIELSLSQVFLVSKGDKQVPVTIAEGVKPGQLNIELPPLEVGDYALRYKVFAADGHLTEDVIHFEVINGPEDD